MRRRSFLSSSAGFLGGGILAGQDGRIANDVRHHVRTVSVMTEAAKRFLALLTPEQMAKAVIPFGDEERKNWFYTPVPPDNRQRDPGLMLRDMNAYQKHMAHALLASGLSQDGYMKALSVMSLERFFNADPDRYYFAIFGTPSDTGTWAYRVDGHHLCQAYTITNGQVVNGPSFFGAFPAEIPAKIMKDGPRTLGQEEDLGFELIHALDEPLQ